MKKFIAILVCLLLFAACNRSYKCVITYEVCYPDTSWVKTYTFDGSAYATYRLTEGETSGVIRLDVYPDDGFNITSTNIAAVPKGRNGRINVYDFKLYRYGFDIDYKK